MISKKDIRRHLRIVVFIIAAISCFATTSCTIERSNNWRLDGYWHLGMIDTLQTGGVLDLSQKRLFWAFQVRLLQVVDRDGVLDSYLFYFDYTKKGKTLQVHHPRVYDKVAGDPVVEDQSVYKEYGINALSEPFEIKELTSSSLVLESDKLRLRFKRF